MILQPILSQFTISFGQLLINQSSKRQAEENKEVTGKSRKRAKTYVKRPVDEPTCSKYVDKFVGRSGQHESDDKDTTITRAYVVSENDEDDSVSITDQDHVCGDVAELPQLKYAGNGKINK